MSGTMTVALISIVAFAVVWLMLYLVPQTRDKAVWIAAGVGALVMIALGVLYGKQDVPSVVRARQREADQRLRLIETNRQTEIAKAAATECEKERQARLDKADTLKIKADEVRQKRFKLIRQQTGDLDLTDVELAQRVNERRVSKA